MEENNKFDFRSLMLLTVITFLGVQMTGCSGTPASEASVRADPQTICQEPRPQMCTREYRPVCAEKKDGSFKTYSNGCTSCTDSNVIGYREGSCESVK